MHAQRPEQLRHELQAVESYLERLNRQVKQVEGARDTIIAELTDSDGQHDRRPTAVR